MTDPCTGPSRRMKLLDKQESSVHECVSGTEQDQLMKICEGMNIGRIVLCTINYK